MSARPDSGNPLLDNAILNIDHLPLLSVIFDRVADAMADRVKHVGTAAPHFSLNTVVSNRIGEALFDYELNAVAGVLRVPALENQVILGFDRDFVYTMVELMFGGDGTEPPTRDERAFSNIERQVCKYLVEQSATALTDAFSLATDARFSFDRLETRVDLAGAGCASAPAFVVSYVMQALNRGGEMFLIVPHSAITPLRQELAQMAPRDTSPDPRWVNQITKELQRTDVTIRAVHETDEYDLGDLTQLKVGDILKLPATPRSRVKVQSAEQPLYWAHVGENEGFHTLRIDEEIDHDKQFLADVLAR